ncbi:transglutaminase family protein [Methylocella silvestris]|uniref:Transglutaminase n=1 Tax=Methylocella silvestris TaxID=199596 RepID=A0A2J7TLT3_METSI|nr:transglutaminase family protein [Methylocella silvestris]PNG27730.1 transglutaminase [Methylocella silvestris]
MIYDIHHVTTYEYGTPVRYAHCSLRLSPIDLPGQKVLSNRLIIDPTPSQLIERVCFFGNRVSSMTISTEHSELVVEVDTSVDVDRPPPPEPSSTPPFEDVREEAYDSESLDKDSPVHFLQPSRYVPRFAPAVDYARESFTPGRPVLEGAAELMRRIRSDFKYDPKATVVSTPISEAFEKRRGVCQDFAHIMIAALRGLGLPAAYISGYIRTIPPPGKKRLEGADAMHAWVSVWCGAEVGWVDLDPTNSMMIGNDHITLAKGRDYADISPVAGIILGAKEQDVDVQVDVIPRDEVEVEVE